MVSEVSTRRPPELRSTGYLVKYKHSMGRSPSTLCLVLQRPCSAFVKKMYILEAVGKVPLFTGLSLVTQKDGFSTERNNKFIMPTLPLFSQASHLR